MSVWGETTARAQGPCLHILRASKRRCVDDAACPVATFAVASPSHTPLPHTPLLLPIHLPRPHLLFLSLTVKISLLPHIIEKVFVLLLNESILSDEHYPKKEIINAITSD
jgi:hypothetical protein